MGFKGTSPNFLKGTIIVLKKDQGQPNNPCVPIKWGKLTLLANN